MFAVLSVSVGDINIGRAEWMIACMKFLCFILSLALLIVRFGRVMSFLVRDLW